MLKRTHDRFNLLVPEGLNDILRLLCNGGLASKIRQATRNSAAMLGALAFVSILGCAVVVAALVGRLDEDARAHELETASGAVSSAIHTQAKSAFNTAHWDDAVTNLYGRLNEDWASANISSTYIVYVIDERGQTLFSRRSDGSIDPPLSTIAPNALRSILRRMPKTGERARQLKEGYGVVDLYGGVPSFFGAMPILPLQRVDRLPTDNLRYLVFVDAIDKPWLRNLEKRFGLSGAHLDSAADGAGMSYAIDGPEGQAVTYLNWMPRRPGQAGLAAISPILFAALGLIILLAGLLARQMRRQEQLVVKTTAAHVQAAQEAEAARAEAEAAYVEAERLRCVAERSAEGEALERQRSAVALRAAAAEIGRDIRAQLALVVGDLAQSANRLDEVADATWDATQAQEIFSSGIADRGNKAMASLDVVLNATEEMMGVIQAIRVEVTTTGDAVAAATVHSSAAAAGASQLLAHAQGIGTASDVIATVAKQTKLLALNASIVSARTDTDRDSFAVIAREIKSLSENSRTSNGEIAGRLCAVTAAAHGGAQAATKIDAELQHIHGSIAKVEQAMVAHEVSGQDIRVSVHEAHADTNAMGRLIQEVTSSISKVRDGVQLTRAVSAQVRERVGRLEQALEKAVADLVAS